VPERLVLYAPSAFIELGVGPVGSDRGAVSVSQQIRFPSPSPEPDMRLPPHPALHEPMPPG
jgi:hypothetical protein